MPLNILVVDRSAPIADTQGNELIARHIFPILRRDHHLTLVAPVSGDEAAARAAMADLFDEVHLVPRARRIPSIAGSLEPALARRGLRVSAPIDSAAAGRLRSAIHEAVGARRVDVAHVRQLPMAGFAADVGTTPCLLELIDSEALASARDPDRSLRGAVRRRLAPGIERRAIRAFDVVTLVAERDARAVRALDPDRRVEVVANGVDVEAFRPRPDVPIDPDSIVFVGAMSFGPNIAAVEWFIREILPRIVAIRPAATFTVVGRDPTPAIEELGSRPGVTVTGRVDDVRAYLAAASVVVTPMVSGSGIKNKVLEALAMQRPVASTPLGVEGVAAVAGRDLVVASDPDELARAIAGLLADRGEAERIAVNGRRLVEAMYTWEAAAARYAGLYAELAAGGPR